LLISVKNSVCGNPPLWWGAGGSGGKGKGSRRQQGGEALTQLVRYIIVRYYDDGSKRLNAHTVSCFSHTWFIFNPNTTFIRCECTWAAIYTRTAHREYCCVSKLPPFAPPCAPFLFLAQWTTLFYLLGNPLLMIVVRMSIQTRPWLVINCSPLAPYPPFPLPTAPTVHVTCFQRRHHTISYIVWYNKEQVPYDLQKDAALILFVKQKTKCALERSKKNLSTILKFLVYIALLFPSWILF
jgi:hypothetical protein